ncbi:MAG: hypothetical protein AAGC55_21020, partial [Myxococcota bacterium]
MGPYTWQRLLCALSLGLIWAGPARAQSAPPSSATPAGAPVPAASAASAASAEVRRDLDGDGADDVIRIDNPPALSVTLSGGGKSAWKPFTTTGRVLVGGTITVGSGPALGGRIAIVAVARFARAPADTRPRGRADRRATVDEAMAVLWSPSGLEPLWTGPVGRQGRDGGYQVVVEATDRGVLRYQTRADVRRCDGRPAYLFPERYDPASRRFRKVYNAPRIPAGAPVITAVADMPAAFEAAVATAPAVAFRSRAASTQRGARHAGELVPPREVDDGAPTTAWREDLGGDGRGEFITLTTLAAAPTLVAVRIVPGDATSRELFQRGNRLRRVGL